MCGRTLTFQQMMAEHQEAREQMARQTYPGNGKIYCPGCGRGDKSPDFFEIDGHTEVAWRNPDGSLSADYAEPGYALCLRCVQWKGPARTLDELQELTSRPDIRYMHNHRMARWAGKQRPPAKHKEDTDENLD